MWWLNEGELTRKKRFSPCMKNYRPPSWEILFEVIQWIFFRWMSRAGTPQAKYLEFLKSLTHFVALCRTNILAKFRSNRINLHTLEKQNHAKTESPSFWAEKIFLVSHFIRRVKIHENQYVALWRLSWQNSLNSPEMLFAGRLKWSVFIAFYTSLIQWPVTGQ